MASSFGLFNTAYSGLAAARAALEVTGQNVANVNTPGYTRQRVDQTSVPGVDFARLSTTGLNIGQGTHIVGIARLADGVIDARVRDTASGSGYWTAASAALGTVETSLGEPGDTGVSQALSNFWSAWQTVGNNPGSTTETGISAANALLGTARTLTARIASGYTAAQQAWTGGLATARGTIAAVNDAGAQIASLNQQIMRITSAGGNANELIDQRSAAITSLAGLAGATTRENANGTVDVLVGGRTFVSGSTVRAISVADPPMLDGLPTAALKLTFAGDPDALQVDGGSLAARLSALGPANGGAGGVYAESAKAYGDLAALVAQQVNGVHAQGLTSDGTTGHAFFGPTTGTVTARTLTVLPTSAAGIAARATGAGALDGSVADRIAQLGTSAASPDATWAAYVSRLGSQAKAATTQADVAGSASTAAIRTQTSQSGVDLDEETANLVVFQHAYQGAARVLTAIDEMLDTLINRTGLVGRA